MIQGMKAIPNRYKGLRGAAVASHKWLIYSSQQPGPLVVPASCILPGTQQTFHDCVQNCSVSPAPISLLPSDNGSPEVGGWTQAPGVDSI